MEPTDETLRFRLCDQSGRLVETVTGGDGARFFSQIFESVPREFIGSVKVESDDPFVVTVLRQELILGSTLRFQLSSVPLTPVP